MICVDNFTHPQRKKCPITRIVVANVGTTSDLTCPRPKPLSLSIYLKAVSQYCIYRNNVIREYLQIPALYKCFNDSVTSCYIRCLTFHTGSVFRIFIFLFLDVVCFNWSLVSAIWCPVGTTINWSRCL